MRGRLLDCTLEDPFLNVALEEALYRLLEAPIIRVWDNQKSIVIGRAQLAKAETDVSKCIERSIPIVRRFTAGGTVYNGPGNVNWSFFEPPRATSKETWNVFDSRRAFSEAADKVVRALSDCSAECSFEPPNRIVNGRGKVSGMAAYISTSGVLCHGTLLVDSDLEEVDELTRPVVVGIEKRYPRSRHAPVANCGVDRARFTRALVAAAGGGYAPDALTKEERDLANRLSAEKYGTDRWNLGDPFGLDDL